MPLNISTIRREWSEILSFALPLSPQQSPWCTRCASLIHFLIHSCAPGIKMYVHNGEKNCQLNAMINILFLHARGEILRNYPFCTTQKKHLDRDRISSLFCAWVFSNGALSSHTMMWGGNTFASFHAVSFVSAGPFWDSTQTRQSLIIAPLSAAETKNRPHTPTSAKSWLFVIANDA